MAATSAQARRLPSEAADAGISKPAFDLRSSDPGRRTSTRSFAIRCATDPGAPNAIVGAVPSAAGSKFSSVPADSPPTMSTVSSEPAIALWPMRTSFIARGHAANVPAAASKNSTVLLPPPATSTSPSPTAVARRTQTFAPVADATVDRTYPSTNLGAATALHADTRPERRSYLRFDVSGLSGPVSSATLRLWVTDGTNDGPAVHAAAAGWDERAITWHDQPGPLGAALSDAGTVRGGGWLELDVTGAVEGDGRVALVLIPSSSNGLHVSSREGAEPPRLSGRGLHGPSPPAE